MTKHHLKTWPQFFAAIWDGSKPFEARKDDREPPFEHGDILRLEEFVPCNLCGATGTHGYLREVPMECTRCNGAKGVYTSRVAICRVTYVLRNHTALQPGYCVMGIEKV